MSADRPAAPDQGAGEPRSVVLAFLAALTGGQPERACALMSEDVEWVNGATSCLVGRAAVLDEMRPVLEASDEADWVITASAASGASVFLERRDRFRRGGTWVEVPVVGVFEVHDGRVTRWRDYFDAADGAARLAPLWS